MADRLEVLKAKYPSETKAIMNKNYVPLKQINVSIMTNENVAELYDLLNAKGLAQVNKDGSLKKSWYNFFGGRKNTRSGRKANRKQRQTRRRR